ncbi:MAG: hypothetical protein E7617_06480 [Ruminococcaceae bacterium]|nr:hypothetical protein [Oscillospiraceae bacterium]
MKFRALLVLGLIFALIALCSCEELFGTPTDVVFDPGNGEAIRTFTVKDLSDVKIPSDPVRAGYKFDGWYFDKDVWAEPFSLTALDEKDRGGEIRIYAKWNVDDSLEYTVKFYVLGELYTTVTDTADSFISPDAPKREGYTFGGWFIDADFKTPFNTDALIPELSGSPVSVYARLIADQPKEITVNLYISGDLYLTLDSDGTTVDLPTSVPTDQSDIFLGWYLDPEFTIPFTIEGVKPSESGNVSAYAKMARKDELKIELLLYCGDELYATVKTDGRYFNMPNDPKRPDQEFLGWYYDEAYNFEFSDTDKIDKTTVLYARFAGESVIVTQRNGDKIDSCKIRYGDSYHISKSIIESDTLKRRFVGWAIAGTGEIITDSRGFSLAPSTYKTNFSVEPVFEDYKYTVILNDRETTSVFYVFADGNLPSYRVPSLYHHTFLGWFTAEEGGDRVELDQDYKVTSDLTLYAVFEEWPKAVYIFDYDGTHSSYSDTPLETEVIEKYVWEGYDHSVWTPYTDPLKTGYVFEDKWICEENGEAYDSSTKIELPAGVYHFKPVFSPITYRITYEYPDTNTETEVTYKYDEVITLPTASCTYEGYVFSHWERRFTDITYNAGDKVTALTTHSGENISLRACYRPIKFTLGIKDVRPDTTFEYTLEVSWGSPVYPYYEREGYVVECWWDGYECFDYPGKSVTEDGGHRDLVIEWKPITYIVALESDSRRGDGWKAEQRYYVYYDQSFTLPQIPTAAGYVHTGWYQSGNYDEKYDNGTVVKNLASTEGEVVSFTATFEGIGFTMVVDMNDGSGRTVSFDVRYSERLLLDYERFVAREMYTPLAIYVPGHGKVYKNHDVSELCTEAGGVVYAEVLWQYAYKGQGYSSDPYKVDCPEALASMYMLFEISSNNLVFELTADIDMTGIDFRPFDYYGKLQTFDKLIGNGHTIKGLKVPGYINGQISLAPNSSMEVPYVKYVDPVEEQ